MIQSGGKNHKGPQRIVGIGLLLLLGLMPACQKADTGADNSLPGIQVPGLTREKLGLPTTALGPLRSVPIKVGAIDITAELAIADDQKTQGLMYRSWLPENHGMLFIYPEEQFMSFWMRNTRLPLSIAFIRADGTIDNIRDMQPFDEQTHHRSKHRCRFALEMVQGWFEENGIKSGDKVLLPPEVFTN